MNPILKQFLQVAWAEGTLLCLICWYPDSPVHGIWIRASFAAIGANFVWQCVCFAGVTKNL